MGIMDQISSFFESRSEDFVPMESMDDKFGPPVVLLFGMPDGIENEEIKDMVSDGAPLASSTETGIQVKRICGSPSNLKWMELSMKEALEHCIDDFVDAPAKLNTSYNVQVSTLKNKIEEDSATEDEELWKPSCPVIYCSGLSNKETMAIYNILASEIYEETGGMARAACAKAVPPAMEKPVMQVITEIAGDHMEAIENKDSS